MNNILLQFILTREDVYMHHLSLQTTDKIIKKGLNA